MAINRRHVRILVAISLSLVLLGGIAPPTTGETAPQLALQERVTLAFETNPDGEAWTESTETDFGQVEFDVYTPHDGQERSAVADQKPSPDSPPSSQHVITNQNAREEPGWLNIRFSEPQSAPRIILWLEPRDERIDRFGNSNTMVVNGYDESNDRVFRRESQLTAGGRVFIEVNPSDALVARIAISIRPHSSGSDFSRFYVDRLSFDVTSPTATFSVSPARPESDDPIAITGSAETNGQIREYEWYIDGARYIPSTGTDGRVIRPELRSGTHTVTLRVTDQLGLQGTTSQTLTVHQAGPLGIDEEIWVAGGFVFVFVLTVSVVLRRRSR